MVNNSEQIRELLKFPDENSFYFLEVIKRHKENPEMLTGQKLIRDFTIRSFEEYDELLPKIVELCEEHTARAYLRLNLRNDKNIAFAFNVALAQILKDEQYSRLGNLYTKIIGGNPSDPNKTWVIDLDGDEAKPERCNEIADFIRSLREDAIVAILPTLNGVHLIARPFNRAFLSRRFPSIDVHKDNPTILYAP